jgi:hypothetical protein
MLPWRPRNASEFEAFMADIDRELQDRAIPIHARPFHAEGEVCSRLRSWTLSYASQCKSEPGNYSGDSLVAHVREWYESHYGERLKIHMGPGTIAVLIRGNPWRVRFPLLLGEFRFRLTPLPIPEATLPRHPLIDPLDSVEDLPPGLRSDLSPDEYHDIATSFILGLEALVALECLNSRPYIHEAVGDQQVAVDHLLATWPQYGNSRWHSLQFAEKLLKCHIVSSGCNDVPREHKLNRIVSHAGERGLAPLDADLIAAVNCSPGVRYGEVTSTLREAFAAHKASMEICRLVAPQIDALPTKGPA